MSPEPVCSNQWHVGLIGYGEVGRILAEDLRKDGVRVSTYDIKLGGAQAAPLREHGKNSVSLWPRRMPTLRRRPISSSPPSPRARRCRGAGRCTSDQAGGLVPGLQLGFARRQEAGGGADRRRRRPLCRGRGDDSVPPYRIK